MPYGSHRLSAGSNNSLIHKPWLCGKFGRGLALANQDLPGQDLPGGSETLIGDGSTLNGTVGRIMLGTGMAGLLATGP